MIEITFPSQFPTPLTKSVVTCNYTCNLLDHTVYLNIEHLIEKNTPI